MKKKKLIALLVIVTLVFTGWYYYSLSGKIIDGYTNRTSYFVGDTCVVYLNFPSTVRNAVELYDVQGNVVQEIETETFEQKVSLKEPWKNGFGYKKTLEYVIPDLPSGIYFWENKVPFIIKNRSVADIVVVYPSNTINAYCNSGKKGLYGYNSSENKEADEISFNRPVELDNRNASREFFKWLDDEKYSVKYICDADMDDYASIKGSKIITLVGHSEYWTRKGRENFDKFVNNGGNAAIFSGNTMWWQVRYNEKKNTMICYREFNEDPIQDTALKTVLWNDSLLDYSIVESIGADFDNGGFGLKEDLGWDGYKVVLANSQLFEGVDVENGEIIKLKTKEYDGIPIIGFTKDSVPIVDTTKVNPYRVNVLGYDFGSRKGKTVGTFIVLQNQIDSGVIINTASMNWTVFEEMTSSEKEIIQQITKNIFNKLLNGSEVFVNQ